MRRTIWFLPSMISVVVLTACTDATTSPDRITDDGSAEFTFSTGIDAAREIVNFRQNQLYTLLIADTAQWNERNAVSLEQEITEVRARLTEGYRILDGLQRTSSMGAMSNGSCGDGGRYYGYTTTAYFDPPSSGATRTTMNTLAHHQTALFTSVGPPIPYDSRNMGITGEMSSDDSPAKSFYSNFERCVSVISVTGRKTVSGSGEICGSAESIHHASGNSLVTSNSQPDVCVILGNDDSGGGSDPWSGPGNPDLACASGGRAIGGPAAGRCCSDFWWESGPGYGFYICVIN